jgi:hypothetical protein
LTCAALEFLLYFLWVKGACCQNGDTEATLL